MIRANGITLAYGKKVLARDISLSLEQGCCTLLCGPNGSGKSTLLRSLASQIPDAVYIPTGIPKVKGFTVAQFVRSFCYKESDWAGRLQAKTQQRTDRALELMGLTELSQRDISTLSDGEFQKACIAAGLSRNAKLLLLDEPSAFLDVDGRAMVLRTLEELARNTGLAVLYSSHDVHEALKYVKRVCAFTPEGFTEPSEKREEVIRKAFPDYKP
ncbi:MAG: ATP-binding cassette domain-containing protein [Bacteroidales bacterium]|nr:ATP-binding cassette domain-containing protein [Bacteroidales bacterium]